MPSVLTIGHSRHSIEEFVELLRRHRVEVLVDARSRPYSRFSPHFSRRPLERAATSASIRYLYLGDAIGGRPADPACLGPDGRVDYDRVEATDAYRRGIDRLVDGIGRFRVCVMCAEEDPSRCHRRLLVARTLVRRGVEVEHIRGDGAIEPEAALRARSEGTQLSLLPDTPRRA